jgi:hypothetical protein
MIAMNLDNHGTAICSDCEECCASGSFGLCAEVVEPNPKEPIFIDQIFNPAILVPLRSQVHRKVFKGVSGCPPMNRGRHFDRKARL